MHPTLTVVGPWEPKHLPLVFAFFLAVVWLWTWLEDRSVGRKRPWNLQYFAELLIEAGVPTALSYALVNRIGPLQVRAYGAMMLLGFACALTWAYLVHRRWGLNGRAVLQASLVLFAGGLVGGRVGFVLLQWNRYASHPQEMVNLWQGGMSWHGGVAGGLLAAWLACRVLKMSFTRFMDMAAAPIALGYALARVGCFLNGCCYGHECDLPWAVTFPQIGPSPPPPVPVHPTQLYDSLGTLVFVIPGILLLDRWVRQPFDRFLTYLTLSSVLRFVVEFYRRGATAELFGPLPQLTKAQAGSIAIIAVCVTVVVWQEVAARRSWAKQMGGRQPEA